MPFNHLRLVPSFRGLGRLQVKGTPGFCSIDRCNSFGLCSSNADRSSSSRCSLWWTRLHWIEIVTSLRLQIGKGLCYMQRTGSGGNRKARQLKVFGRANQDSMKRVSFRSSKRWRCILVVVLWGVSASCSNVCEVRTYRDDHRAGPWGQLLVLIQVPVRFDTLDLASESKKIVRCGCKREGNVSNYRLSSPDWPGPRVTPFNSNTAWRTLPIILDTSSIPRVLVKTSPRI